jgi:hypothetical protein
MLYNGSRFSNFRVIAKKFLNKRRMPINGSTASNFRALAKIFKNPEGSELITKHEHLRIRHRPKNGPPVCSLSGQEFLSSKY